MTAFSRQKCHETRAAVKPSLPFLEWLASSSSPCQRGKNGATRPYAIVMISTGVVSRNDGRGSFLFEFGPIRTASGPGAESTARRVPFAGTTRHADAVAARLDASRDHAPRDVTRDNTQVDAPAPRRQALEPQ